MRSTCGSSMPWARPTSRTAARAFMRPKVTICATWSLAVLLDRVADHLLALVVGEVQVEVGHGDAAGVEEALEDQVVLERVDAGDARAVGDERAGARAAHVPPDVAAAGKVAQVGHDQEVDVEAHLVDDRAVRVLCAPAPSGSLALLAVEPRQPFLGQVAQIGLVGEALRDGQVGQVVGGVLQVDLAHLGDAQRVVEGAGRQVDEGAEGGFHLLAALEEVGAVAHAHAVLLA